MFRIPADDSLKKSARLLKNPDKGTIGVITFARKPENVQHYETVISCISIDYEFLQREPDRHHQRTFGR